MSESRYLDIGKFFREKDYDIEKLITKDNINAFYEGYENLPIHWYKLAKIKDIASMIGFINRDNIKEEWIKEIKNEIIKNINIVKEIK